MKWLKKIFSRNKPDALRRFRSEPIKLTLDEWRKNTQLVESMMTISSQPVWRALLQVMRNESPSELVFPSNVALTDRAAHQAKIEGYHMALNNLEAMSVPDLGVTEAPEATFAPEEKDDV